MNNQHLFGEILKTIGQGALCAMIFGTYQQYNTNKIMELNNQKVEIQHRYFMNEMENEHKLFNEKLKHLEKVVSQIEKQNGVNN